jgi:polysaccharide biosynthesis/export protein
VFRTILMWCRLFVMLATPSVSVLLGQGADSLGSATETTQSGYRITPGDILSLQVFGRPQLQRDAIRVETDGSVRLPLIKDAVSVACKTEREVAADIVARFQKFLVDPQISVAVKEFNSKPVELTGAVNRPGPFQLQRAVRLRELVMRAGGLAPAAGQTIQVIHDEALPYCDQREVLGPNPGAEPVLLVSLSAANVMSGMEASNPWIRPGDLINIPNADLIFVVGNVVRPSSLPLTAELTLTRAIALAGGALPSSKNSVRILRATENGLNKEFQVDLQSIAKGSARDMPLQAGDIVELPVSQGKQLLKGALSAITSMGPIYYPLTIVR